MFRPVEVRGLEGLHGVDAAYFYLPANDGSRQQPHVGVLFFLCLFETAFYHLFFLLVGQQLPQAVIGLLAAVSTAAEDKVRLPAGRRVRIVNAVHQRHLEAIFCIHCKAVGRLTTNDRVRILQSFQDSIFYSLLGGAKTPFEQQFEHVGPEGSRASSVL